MVGICENMANRCKATFTKVGVDFRPIAKQNKSNSHKRLNCKSHLSLKSNSFLKTSELNEADLEFQSNACSILKNKFSKNSDFVARLDPDVKQKKIRIFQ